MSGILVAGAQGLHRPPSQHYAEVYERAEVSMPLRALVAALVDGAVVESESDELAVITLEETSAAYARIAVRESTPGAVRCFVIDLWARTEKDLVRTPDNRDARGTPCLLDDVVKKGKWQLYNCYVTLQPWPRRSLDLGRYPKHY